jgi:hypothetical protein
MGLGVRSLVALMLAGTAVQAFGLKSVTVEQFDQWVVSEHSKSDGKTAHQIPDMELSERASAADLARWEAALPGPRTREALIALADASRFLDPAAAELTAKPAPDIAAQQSTLSMAVEYVSRTLPKLPDFSATRQTMHFEDTPAQRSMEQSSGVRSFAQGGQYRPEGTIPKFVPAKPMHFVTESSVLVTYRDGFEVRDTPSTSRAKIEAQEGFTTSGEFGPMLSVVVGDAVRSDLRWGYWEQDSAMLEAVFHYSVPQQQSHYTVGLPNDRGTVTLSPAYHGEIAVDPATGNILRLTAIADLEPPYQQVQVEILVEYGPVEIGAQTYTCPVKGVAISRIPVPGDSGDAKHPAPVQTRLNEVSFTQYHLFRAETKILP